MTICDNRTSNDIIFMHRGDDFTFNYIINRGTSTCPDYYTLRLGDHLLMSICEANQPFECGIIRKIFTYLDNSDPVTCDCSIFIPVKITIPGSDTINLLPGTYYYSFKVCQGELGDSITETTLSRKKFVILD